MSGEAEPSSHDKVATASLCRLLQGLGWGGAALMAVEHATANRRGFQGSWPFSRRWTPASRMTATSTTVAADRHLGDDHLEPETWPISVYKNILALITVVSVYFAGESRQKT